MSERTTAPEPVLPEGTDFDTWDEEAEAAAVEAVAATGRVRYVVGDGGFYGRFPDGHVVVTPLRMSADTLSRVIGLGDSDQWQQVEALLRLLGQDEDADYIRGADITAVVDYATKYFNVFSRVMGISLGE
jgi:ATP-dependent serine clp protease